jgi:hypothetical protein
MKKKLLKTSIVCTLLFTGLLCFQPNQVEAQVIGAKKCVCKSESCESSAFVSFRKMCGQEPCGNNLEPLGLPGSATCTN